MTPAEIRDAVRTQIRDLRDRAAIGRDELAERARHHGAGDTMTATVIGNLERGRRSPSVDELLAIALALDVPLVEVLGDAAAELGTPTPAPCLTCGGEDKPGPVGSAIRLDLDDLGEALPMEAVLRATAIRLATAIDDIADEDLPRLPALARELRTVVAQIAAGRNTDPDDEDDLGDLDEPE